MHHHRCAHTEYPESARVIRVVRSWYVVIGPDNDFSVCVYLLFGDCIEVTEMMPLCRFNSPRTAALSDRCVIPGH